MNKWRKREGKGREKGDNVRKKWEEKERKI